MGELRRCRSDDQAFAEIQADIDQLRALTKHRFKHALGMESYLRGFHHSPSPYRSVEFEPRLVFDDLRQLVDKIQGRYADARDQAAHDDEGDES